jgi:trimethylamine--corrinoid protein Co-methyltransferase
VIHLPVLGSSGVRQIHEATLRLLSETGIVLEHPAARGLLLDHGARVVKDRVLLPAHLVEMCAAQSPPSVKLAGRDPGRFIELGPGQVQAGCHAHNVGGVPNVIEAVDNGRRPALRADVARAARLLDALPHVSSVTPLFTPQDVRPSLMTLWMTYDTLANTTKPVRAPGVQAAREVRALAELFSIACPDGTMTIGVSPVSPLTFPNDIADAMLEAARRGLVLGPLPCPIMGATAPMSMAGALAQQNAEVLASVVLARLTNPGLPVIYKGRLSIMDPSTGTSVWGNPEIGLAAAATVEMGHYYGIPVDVYGLSTNAHTLDMQNGFERALNALLPVLAAADEISGVGEMEGGVSSSLAQMVIDNEILAVVLRMTQGFEVTGQSLAVAVPAGVVDASPGLAAPGSADWQQRPGAPHQTDLARWLSSGNQGITQRAEEMALDLLASHDVERLSREQRAAMKGVIRAAM